MATAILRYMSDIGTPPAEKEVTLISGKYTFISDDLPVMTYDGYSFAGWYFDGEYIEPGDELHADDGEVIELNAGWGAAVMPAAESDASGHVTEERQYLGKAGITHYHERVKGYVEEEIDAHAVKYDADQGLTDEQKTQARENIGAVSDADVQVIVNGLGALASKDTVAKTDLDASVQASLELADSALQSFTETDPTVPSWAKQATKPSYTASEVGADEKGTASSAVSTHNSSGTAHSDIRTLANNAQSAADEAASAAEKKLDKSGGTMTGALVLAADPTSAMHAATMQWVQTQIESAVGAAIGGSY